MRRASQNIGPSAIVSFGDHTGGELFVAQGFRSNKRVPRQILDCHNTWYVDSLISPVVMHAKVCTRSCQLRSSAIASCFSQYFDGNLAHCTLPITGNGERFSLVFFSTHGALSPKFAKGDQAEVMAHGFRMPTYGANPTGSLVYQPKDASKRLSHGRKQYAFYLAEREKADAIAKA